MSRMKALSVLWLMVIICLTGCTPGQTTGEPIIKVEKERTEVEYTLGIVSVQDVIKTQKVNCTYRQVKDQKTGFSVSGKIISNVYVKEGDSVQKGQLLAELRNEDINYQIQELQYQIDRNQLLIEHANTNINYEISTKWLEYMGEENQSKEGEKAVKKSVEEIQRKYGYLLEDYNDAVFIHEMKLENLLQEKSHSSLYAGMSGTVSYVKPDVEGSTSKEGETIITIIDNSECIFVSEEIEWADYFLEEEEIDMEIHTGSGAGDYKLYPIEMSNWQEALSFALTEESQNAVIDVGTRGTIYLILDERRQVLSVPASAVYSADGEYYVYVVGESGMKEVKWITVGLFGDQNVEVIAGLTEGEKIILK